MLTDRSDELLHQAISVVESWERRERSEHPTTAHLVAIEAMHCSLSIAGFMSHDVAITVLQRSLARPYVEIKESDLVGGIMRELHNDCKCFTTEKG